MGSSEVVPANRTPLALALVGFCLGLPNIVCAGYCGGIVGALGKNAEGGMKQAMILAAIPLGMALVGGFLATSRRFVGGLLLISAALFTAFSIFLSGNLFGFIPAILFLIGGIIALLQKRR